MNPYLLKIIGVIIVKCMFVLVTKAFFDIFLIKRKMSIVIYLPWILFFIWEYIFTVYYAFSLISNLMITTSILLLTNLIFYLGNVFKKITIIIFYLCLGTLVELCVGYIFSLFGLNFTSHSIQLFNSTFITIGFCIVTLLMKIICKSIDIKHQIDDTYSLKLLFIFNMCICIIEVAVINSSALLDLKIPLIIIFMICTMQSVVFWIFIKHTEMMNKKIADLHVLYRQNLRLLQDQTKIETDTDKSVEIIYHDLKHHFLALDGYLDAASNYLQAVMQSSHIQDNNRIAHTGCIAVDAIINQKYETARKHLIDFQADLSIFPDMMIDNMSLTIILGNALDNAIEAVLNVPEPERFIKINLNYNMSKPEYQVLEIEVINPYRGSVRKNSLGELITTKKDKKNHGIGIYSIKTEVQRYNGTCQFDPKDNLFVFRANLYIVMKAKHS